MKARLIIFPALVLALSAGLTLTTGALTPKAASTKLGNEALATQQDNDAKTAEALADKVGCLECHRDKKIGPRYPDVAAKYKDDPRAREALMQVVKKGGKGNWLELTGGTPMPSFARRLSDDEIRRLINWVLSQ